MPKTKVPVPVAYVGGVPEEAYRAGYRAGYFAGMKDRAIDDAQKIAIGQLATDMLSTLPESLRSQGKKAAKTIARNVRKARAVQDYVGKIAAIFDDDEKE